MNVRVGLLMCVFKKYSSLCSAFFLDVTSMYAVAFAVPAVVLLILALALVMVYKCKARGTHPTQHAQTHTVTCT